MPGPLTACLRGGRWSLLLVLLCLGLLSGCAPWQPAPVEDRRAPPPRTTQAPPPQRPQAPPLHEVRRGDTLYSIAFRYGLDWRDIARWNRIDAPYTIRPGQELRLTSPPAQATAPARPSPPVAATPPAGTEPVAVEPAPPARTAPTSSVPSTSAPASTVPPTETRPPPATSAPAPASTSAEQPGGAPSRSVAGVAWRWPAAGPVVRPFDPAATRRGIGIGGSVGQNIVAAADGEVVYSGTALIGYGELIIIKHSETMLSAYGHNRRRLVEEGARVRAGQAIAEMGMNERDEAVLHFEIRRNGQPEDPLRFLPVR